MPRAQVEGRDSTAFRVKQIYWRRAGSGETHLKAAGFLPLRHIVHQELPLARPDQQPVAYRSGPGCRGGERLVQC